METIEIAYEIDPDTPSNIVRSITDCPFGNEFKKKIAKVGSFGCMFCPDFKKSNPKTCIVLCKREIQ